MVSVTRACRLAAVAIGLASPAAAALDFAWTSTALLTQYRAQPGVGVVNGRIYLFGGSTDASAPCGTAVTTSVDAYDPVGGVFVSAGKAGMPTARFAMASGVVGGNVYLIGGGKGSGAGFTPYAVNELYNAYFNTWTTALKPMPTARGGVAGAVVNGLIYVIGGWTGAAALKVNERYDPATDQWAAMPDMPTARVVWTAGVVNGRIYVIGGSNGAGGVLGTNEAFDPVANTWATKASMPTARSDAALAVLNGRVYAIGGDDGANVDSTVEEYNPATDTWQTKLGFNPIYSRSGMAPAVVNGEVFVFGGCGSNVGNQGNRGRLYHVCDSPLLTWSRTYAGSAAPNDTARGVAVDGSGSVYVAGDEDRTDLGQDFDWRVSKYAPGGTLLWSVSYNGAANGADRAFAVAADAAGHIVVAGAEQTAAPATRWLVRAYDDGGTLAWSRTYDSPAALDDEALAVVTDAGGTSYVAGFETRTDLAQAQNWMTRAIAPDGSLLWSRSFVGAGASADLARAVAVDASGSVYVAGDQGANWGVIKYDDAGGEIWGQTYVPVSTGHAQGVATLSSGDVVVAGYDGSPADWRILDYFSTGIANWSQTYNDPANSIDDAYAVAVDSSDRIIVAGTQNRPDKVSHFYDWNIAGYHADGSTIWDRDFNYTTNNDVADAVGVDRATSAFVVAGSVKDGVNVLWCARKYVRTACVAASLSFGSPQPATGETFTVSLTVTNDGEVAALAVSPTLLIDSGTAFVAFASGPLPAVPLTVTPGGSQTFTYTFVVRAPGAVGFSGAASGTDAGTGRIVDEPVNASLVTFPPVILSPSLSVAPDPVLVGGVATAVFTIANTGTLAALSVSPTLFVASAGLLAAPLTGPLPSGTVSIAAGASRSFTWTFSVTAGGLITFTATAGGEDVNRHNVAAAAPPRVVRATPLRATVAAMPSPGMVGTWEEARLTVENVAAYAVSGFGVSLSVTGGAALVSERVAGDASGLTLAARTARTFTWRYNGEDAGDVRFTCSASGTDGSSGNAVTAAADTTVTILAPTLRVYPVPYRPATAVRGTVKFEGLYEGAVVRVYTMSGRLVWEGGMTGGPVEWDGRNEQGEPVAGGVYLWIADNRARGRLTGKLILIR